MRKKTLSLLLILALILGLAPASASAGETKNDLTVFVSIADMSSETVPGFQMDKDSEQAMIRVPVTLDAGSSPTAADALKQAHELYHENGADSYTFSGGYFSEFWGTSTYNIGYFQDGKMIMTPSPLTGGEDIEGFIYNDWSQDIYTRFDRQTASIKENEKLVLTLYGETISSLMYQAAPAAPSSPVSGASILVGDQNSLGLPYDDSAEWKTDENGKITVSFPSPGTYFLSAQNSAGTLLPASCTITVTESSQEDEQIQYVSADKEALSVTYTDGRNLVLPKTGASGKTKISWRSDNPSVISETGIITKQTEKKAVTLTATITCGSTSQTKTFILTIPGYTQVKQINAENVLHNIAAKYAKNGITSDENAAWLAADLAAYASAFPDTKNLLSAEQKQTCLNQLVALASNSEKPGDLAKCIIALRALGYDPCQAVTANGKEIHIVKKLRDLIDAKSNAVTNVYTLPYVIIALQQGKDYASANQIDYLISAALTSQETWMNTQYGIDAIAPMILALAPYADSRSDIKTVLDSAAKCIKNTQEEDGLVGKYDFWDGSAASAGLAMTAFSALGINSEELEKEPEGNSLVDGLMTQVTNSMDGFSPIENTFAAEQGFRGLISLALLKKAGGEAVRIFDFADNPAAKAEATPETDPQQPSDSTSESEKQIKVTVKVLTHDPKHCGGTCTYKSNPSAYTTVLAEETVTLNSGQTVLTALKTVLKNADISFTESSGYISKIGNDEEGGHGSSNSGWLFLVNGKTVSTGAQNAKLTKDSTVIWFYTDDYTGESGFGKEDESGSDPDAPGTDPDGTGSFTDIKDHWAAESILYVNEKGLMKGTGSTAFSPDCSVTRAMLATILYRLAGEPKAASESSFSDITSDSWYTDAVSWAAENDIVKGYADGTFRPMDQITREQIAVLLLRYSIYQKYDTDKASELSPYTDKGHISPYAVNALKWANAAGLIHGRTDTMIIPKGTATRAEIAAILERFCKTIVK